MAQNTRSVNRRALLRAAHRDAMTAALKLGRAMPGQYEGFRKQFWKAQERFERAVRRYVPKGAGGL